ncbi:hypothetical protein B0H14DRAFT_2599851 [Mycena olivaceomarginata]|nr:hypothetical protein B0H14DRAFT_2599851 [Mycena olivaceomarginata]
MLFVVVDGMGEIPVHLVGSQTTGTATIESGLTDAWDAIRALIVAAVGESQDFAGAKVEIIAPDQKTSLSYPQARFVTGSSATEPFRAWERKFFLMVSAVLALPEVQGGSYMGQIFGRHLLTVGIEITGTAQEIWVANEKSEEMQWHAVEVEYNAGTCGAMSKKDIAGMLIDVGELEGIVVSEEVAAEYSGVASVAKGEKQNSTKNDKKHTRWLVTRSRGINIRNVPPVCLQERGQPTALLGASTALSRYGSERGPETAGTNCFAVRYSMSKTSHQTVSTAWRTRETRIEAGSPTTKFLQIVVEAEALKYASRRLSNLSHKREYFDDVTFNPSCRCHLLTRRHRDITPPNTPQSHQKRRRQLQRDARESQDGSLRRRRIPARNHDENIPARNHDENVPPGTRMPAEPSARSLSQRRRRQLERENRPQPPQTPPPTNRSQAQAARRRAEKEAQSAQMDVDGRGMGPSEYYR